MLIFNVSIRLWWYGSTGTATKCGDKICLHAEFEHCYPLLSSFIMTHLFHHIYDVSPHFDYQHWIDCADQPKDFKLREKGGHLNKDQEGQLWISSVAGYTYFTRKKKYQWWSIYTEWIWTHS